MKEPLEKLARASAFAAALAGVSSGARAAAAPAPEAPVITLPEIVITGEMDADRERIAPALGAVAYDIGSDQIRSMPQGADASFQQVLLRAPGVVQDEFGEVHVRGDHGDLQYRVNGVLLPESLNGFGQEIDTRLIRSVTLMTGTLPAQFGFRTAGIIDVNTKTGSELGGGEVSVYGGSYHTIEPSAQLGGTSGKLDYFVVASEKHSDLGIDNTTSSPTPLHDVTDQKKGFGYFSYRLDDSSRLTLLLSASYADFQIPDTAGLSPLYHLAGDPEADSSKLDESQNELNNYAVLSYQKSGDDFSGQASLFARDADIRFNPDPVQSLLFQGLAGQVENSDFADGAQADASWTLDDKHTLRGGLLATEDEEKLNTNTAVFAVGSSGQQTSDQPFAIADNSGNSGLTAGVYLQDEWRLNDRLTINYGARYDRFDASFDHEGQLSPRANLVWAVDDRTTAHAGYARYFMPPTLQYVSPSTIVKFEGTSNAPFNEQDDPQKVERDDYFDLGLSRRISAGWQVTADSFCKLAKNLLDDGQFGSAVILNNFNYRKGTIYGAELSSTYKGDAISAYANFSYVQTSAQDIDSAQFEFPSAELAYVAAHSIRLDHQQNYTASAGAAYTLMTNTRFDADLLYGSGLRAGFANLEQLPAYHPVNVGLERVFPLRSGSVRELKLRLDCLNVFDEDYELRNGTGLGIAAPAYGPRRALYAGLSAAF